MKMKQFFFRSALALAVMGVAAPHEAYSAQPAPNAAVQQQQIMDIALYNGGVFVGQAMDAQGNPQANSKVVLVKQGEVVATAQTDQQGRFFFRDVAGGSYEVRTSQSVAMYRAWAPGTAPPAARQGALLVAEGDVVRGQVGDGTYGPAIRGAIAGGLVTGLTYWALDYNKSGS